MGYDFDRGKGVRPSRFLSLFRMSLFKTWALCAAAFALAVIPVSAETGEDPAASSVPLFLSGRDNSYKSIRIPALITGRDGRLLAFAEGRKNVGDQGMNDLILRTSDDNGKTWSPIRVIAESGKATFNNPCPVYDGKTGKIFVMFQRYPEGVRERQKGIPTGLEGEKIIRNFVISSQDNGETWSAPVDVTKTTKRPEGVDIFATGPNAGIQIKHGKYKGRLVIPMNEGPFGDWVMSIAYSDDGGRSWRLSNPVKGPLGWVNETAVAELDNGDVMLNARKWKGKGLRKVATTHNGGLSWSPLKEDEALFCDSTQGCLLRYSFPEERSLGAKSRLLYAGVGKNRRQNGTVYLSYNNGKTWSHSKIAIPGPYAYSSMARLGDGSVGLLYEPAGDHEIRFTTFTLDWLTDGKDKATK